jgi:glycosyltransferase involved in cell wall biosynthesis
VTVDVILPSLNEASALPWILDRIPAGFRPIVVDNCSTDGSGEVARSLATVVLEPSRGFGAAGLRVADLPELRDVAADAVAVARQAPRSRFAARVRELAPVLSPVGRRPRASVPGATA